MATTGVVKEKDIVIFRIESSKHIGTLFNLQDNVVVCPSALCIDTIFEFDYKR